jgi:hypothetical protein
MSESKKSSNFFGTCSKHLYHARLFGKAPCLALVGFRPFETAVRFVIGGTNICGIEHIETVDRQSPDPGKTEQESPIFRYCRIGLYSDECYQISRPRCLNQSVAICFKAERDDRPTRRIESPESLCIHLHCERALGNPDPPRAGKPASIIQETPQLARA